ncbi:uncharacterized protein LOC103703528 [Phoenix dactylifera]|uniref:Uncharacterized protein LOC103703528 n=1 Tax=Phoenix dactylifera TaxID=42345 RepID=A0A8B7BSR6_PHODC|nr:uncharacterized protein LOC103703528 [Phoenix dactylifera]
MPATTLFPFLFLTLLLLVLVNTARPEDLGGAEDDACPTVLLSDGNSSTSAFSSSCPINCFRADPVCGVDGVTYWCGCPEAACAGVRVAKRAPCQVGNGGSGLVSGQALLLVHIVWLIVLGFAVLFGFL